ncbi:MAG: hypothetical protein ACYC61_00900 [Isosphaeraceae bacterium]
MDNNQVTRMNALRPQISRWISRLPNWAVMAAIVLIGLVVMGLLGAAILVMFVQALRPSGGHDPSFMILAVAFVTLVLVLAYPMVYLLALLMRTSDAWIDDPCPSCRRRELEWTSEGAESGEPPAYRYLRCRFCGAEFRQLWGGEGARSDLEPFDPTTMAP